MKEDEISLYSNVYEKILELGESKLTDGISYHQLLDELKENVKLNNCSKTAIKKFFCDNFFHKELHEGKSSVTLLEFDTHHNCNFVMSGEAWSKLQQYRHFQNSKTQIDLLQSQINLADQKTQEAKRDSRFARNLAWASIGLSIILGLPDWYSLYKSYSIDHLTLQIETSIKSIPIKISETNEIIDSLIKINSSQKMEETKFKAKKIK